MERVPPPVVVTAIRRGGGDPEVLAAGPPPRRPLPPWVRPVAVAAVVVLGAGGLVARDARTSAPPDPPAVAPVTGLGADRALTATASLGAVRTDQPVQRLTLTVVLLAYDGRGDSGGWLLGDEVVLVDVRVRGFAVVPDDRRAPVLLGRFGRRNSPRTTTLPLAATVTDCAVETLARREVVLGVRAGEGPERELRATVEPAVVGALDRLVSRTCRRPRG